MSPLEIENVLMEGIIVASQLMRSGCCMASIDLKDAYYLIPKGKEYQKYLKFLWKSNMY